MNLNLSWSAPSPTPSCGYKARYRRESDPTYTESDLSSGTTLSIVIDAPASYEGKIISNCCSESESEGLPFGVNGYLGMHVTSVLVGNGPGDLTLHTSSAYPNSYDVLVSGIVVVDLIHPPVNYTVTQYAGETSGTTLIGSGYSGSSILSVSVSSISPIFNNGGQIQQLDVVNTPAYFKFYRDSNISGTTWDGSPSSLPSFITTAFNITEISTDGTTVLAGNLLISYILSQVYSNNFTFVTFEVYDASNALVGSMTSYKEPLGLRNETIPLTKVVSALNSSTQFTMKVRWPDNTLVNSVVFYFPSP